MAKLIKKEEFEAESGAYIREIFDNGTAVVYPKPSDDIGEPTVEEPTEDELIQAEILLNQADILAKQNEQDEVLAEILLNQMGGVSNV